VTNPTKETPTMDPSAANEINLDVMGKSNPPHGIDAGRWAEWHTRLAAAIADGDTAAAWIVETAAIRLLDDALEAAILEPLKFTTKEEAK
jgi:hypothetical protein